MLDHDEDIDDVSSLDNNEDNKADIGAGETSNKGEEDSNEEQIVFLTKEQINWYPTSIPQIKYKKKVVA